MKILLVGGTGHIGSYLVPRLVLAGHEVTVVARHPKPRYTDPRLGWPAVRFITADRPAEEKTGQWANRMRDIPCDVVIDCIAFTPQQNNIMIDAFRGRINHFIHIGTLWAYGRAERVPCEESDPRRPITDYGKAKAQIEADLHHAWHADRFPATVLHPGHICGKKWLPIDPQGSRDGVGVYRKLARGEAVVLPDTGLATLHHVHADDIAQLCERAIARPQASLGESFSAVSPRALTLAACCRTVAALFGKEPNLQFVPLAELENHINPASAAIIREHVLHSPCASIAKARRLLGYQPRYTTEQIYAEALEHLLETGQLTID
jgi:nucleoside-diphosphate-sugar epimerase